MNKKVVLSIAVGLLCYIILFLCWSFVAMDFNPQKWDIDARVGYVFIGGIVSIFLAVGAYFEFGNNEK